MASRHQRRCPAALAFLIATSLARPSLSFAPPLLANRAVPGGPTSTGGRRRASSSWVCLNQASSAPALRAGPTPGDGGPVDDSDIDELVGIDEFRAGKVERDRKKARRVAPPPAAPPAAAASSGKGVDLGLGGAIFPGDAFPGSPGTEDITLTDTRLENGQPHEMVGFWQLYGNTDDGEDLSSRLILRADGRIVGGPTVRNTLGVKWSDPEGLKPVGGRWGVYSDKRTGRARLRFTIMLSFQKKQQLEMDGVVMMVDGAVGEMVGPGGAALESAAAPEDAKPQPQVFGGVRKRSGEALEEGEGDFSMMKVAAGMDKLIATVGPQQKRFW